MQREMKPEPVEDEVKEKKADPTRREPCWKPKRREELKSKEKTGGKGDGNDPGFNETNR